MNMNKNKVSVDISSPRQAVYQVFEGAPGPCPECGGALHNYAKPYVAATRKGNQMADGVVIGGDFGWFCMSCPVVVIDVDKLKGMMSLNKPDWNVGPEFLLMGIIDFDALPEDKRQLSLKALGDDLPLVIFSNLADEKDHKQKRRRHKKR